MGAVDEVVAAIARAGGICHRDQLRAAGLTDNALRNAVSSRAVTRVRRAWFATAAAPADLVRAASVGGRLTCVSATTRLGCGLRTMMWVTSRFRRIGAVCRPIN